MDSATTPHSPVVADDAPRPETASKAAREQAWLAENAEAIAAWNAYVEEHGLPLAAYRPF